MKSVKLNGPRFQVGDHVFHRRKGIKGVVTNLVNLGDREDIALQGHRYYLLVGREVWSVREAELLLEKKSNDFRAKAVYDSFLFPSGAEMRTKVASSTEPDALTVLLEKEEQKSLGRKK